MQQSPLSRSNVRVCDSSKNVTLRLGRMNGCSGYAVVEVPYCARSVEGHNVSFCCSINHGKVQLAVLEIDPALDFDERTDM